MVDDTNIFGIDAAITASDAIPFNGEDTVISFEDISEQIADITLQLNAHSDKMNESYQKMFKEFFGADYFRGDLIIFPASRQATFHMLIERLPTQIGERVKLDTYNLIKEPTVVKGSGSLKGVRWDGL